MIKEVTIFHNIEELSELTGLREEELWDKGFDLDDMNGGIRMKEMLAQAEGSTIYDSNLYNRPEEDVDLTIERVLEDGMSRFCVGYETTEYDGYIYAIIHHS